MNKKCFPGNRFGPNSPEPTSADDRPGAAGERRTYREAGSWGSPLAPADASPIAAQQSGFGQPAFVLGFGILWLRTGEQGYEQCVDRAVRFALEAGLTILLPRYFRNPVNPGGRRRWWGIP
jgi:hypothetical protein